MGPEVGRISHRKYRRMPHVDPEVGGISHRDGGECLVGPEVGVKSHRKCRRMPRVYNRVSLTP